MVAITAAPVLLLVAVGHALLQPRTFAQISTDLENAANDENNIRTGLNSFGSGPGGIPIANYIQDLENDLTNCSTDARRTSPLTSAQAQSAIQYLNGTFYINAKNMLTAFSAKKSQLAAAGLKSTVLSDLITMKNDTDACVGAIDTIAPTPQKKQVSQVASAIDALYNSAIAVYEN